MLLVSFAPSTAQLYRSNLDRPFFLRVNVSLNNALTSGVVLDKAFSNGEAMRAFYNERQDQPFWVGMFGLSSDAQDLIGVLENSWAHGFNPETYHLSQIHELGQQSGSEKKASLEVLLMDGFIRYVHDLSGIRIKPAGLRVDSESWKQPIPAVIILDRLSKGEKFTDIINSVAPQGSTYRLLQQELIRLSALKDEPYAAILPISFKDVIMRPGLRHEAIPALRLRMGVQAQSKDLKLYDDRLAAAVMKFQRENNLASDGIIGANTLRILNRTRRGQILQVIANLERLRWVNEARPQKFVVVNIPSSTLWAIDNGKVAFEMDVIVGSIARPTDSFIAMIDGVRFNPDWTVPSTIKKHDILPKVQEDHNYLIDKGIELTTLTKNGRETLDPSSIDWENITAKELNAIQMVQIPGEHNPLGQIRILMPNKFNIYLHDTNHRDYFEKRERAISSGCIRLREPQKMAQFVMKEEKNWSEDEMKKILSTTKTRDMKIENPIPVYVLYYTIWTDESGTLVYGNDIYNQDIRLINMLKNIDGFSIPGDTAKSASGVASATLADVR